jgi:hypothetical protein
MGWRLNGESRVYRPDAVRRLEAVPDEGKESRQALYVVDGLGGEDHVVGVSRKQLLSTNTRA